MSELNRREVLEKSAGVAVASSMALPNIETVTATERSSRELSQFETDFLEVRVQLDAELDDPLLEHDCLDIPNYYVDANKVCVSPPGFLDEIGGELLVGDRTEFTPVTGAATVSTDSIPFSANRSGYLAPQTATSEVPDFQIESVQDGYRVRYDEETIDVDSSGEYETSTSLSVEYRTSSGALVTDTVTVSITALYLSGATVVTHDSKRLLPHNRRSLAYVDNLVKNGIVSDNTVEILDTAGVIAIDDVAKGGDE